MRLNLTLLKILEILSRIKTIKNVVAVKGSSIAIADFIEVNDDSIKLNKLDVESKIIFADSTDSNSIDLEKFEEFIKCLSSSIIRLNHVGISYFCKDLIWEIDYYKNELKNSPLSIYEEESGMAEKKWIFIGDNSNWQDTLFELILVQSDKELQNVWLPDFQVDVDASLSAEEIKKIANKTIRQDFIDWEFDIPDHGIVLCSGILGDINGTKISIGIGTNIRNSKYQRENLTKLN